MQEYISFGVIDSSTGESLGDGKKVAIAIERKAQGSRR